MIVLQRLHLKRRRKPFLHAASCSDGGGSGGEKGYSGRSGRSTDVGAVGTRSSTPGAVDHELNFVGFNEVHGSRCIDIARPILLVELGESLSDLHAGGFEHIGGSTRRDDRKALLGEQLCCFGAERLIAIGE